ncbi:MAG: nucleoside diphosphate kinase regulator [Xanthomonadaceae bacterium]|jgi:regulator of nucleoside diphosphate kinase|nr:nucleoside diphosphate kinase regulator [Xanthomonadaceae bacterium]
MSSQSSGRPSPPITISTLDMARLESLLDAPGVNQQPAALALVDELNRAEVLPPEQMPNNIVTMRSRVECMDTLTGESHILTLVYPNEADADQGKISVLAPVGCALLGLTIGQTIDWNAPGGRKLRLRVDAIRYQPEAAGDLLL